MVPENGFEVLRRVFVDFEGISLRRRFLHGLEPENIHMMIGEGPLPLALAMCLVEFSYCLPHTERCLFGFLVGSMTIDCLGILSDLSDCEDKLFPIGYQ